jgi:hypothetical protein
VPVFSHAAGHRRRLHARSFLDENNRIGICEFSSHTFISLCVELLARRHNRFLPRSVYAFILPRVRSLNLFAILSLLALALISPFTHECMNRRAMALLQENVLSWPLLIPSHIFYHLSVFVSEPGGTPAPQLLQAYMKMIGRWHINPCNLMKIGGSTYAATEFTMIFTSSKRWVKYSYVCTQEHPSVLCSTVVDGGRDR